MMSSGNYYNFDKTSGAWHSAPKKIDGTFRINFCFKALKNFETFRKNIF